MADEPVKKPDWAIVFLSRLCVIGWVSSIFYETLNFLAPIRPLFLLIGFWSSLMAFLYAIGLMFFRRNGVFFIFLLISIPPTLHFGLVVKNIAVEKKWIDPAVFGGPILIETKNHEVIPEQTTAPESPAP